MKLGRTKRLTYLFGAVLFASTALADPISYRKLQGNWSGELNLGASQEALRFDIYDAPCQWGQPNETPYLVQFEDRRTDIIATGILPDGTISLGLFPWVVQSKKYTLVVMAFSESNIEGLLAASDGTSPGTFRFTKQTPHPKLVHCYHKDSLKFARHSGDGFVFDIYSLRFGDAAAYCCDGRSFAQCTLSRSACRIPTITGPPDYQLIDHDGTTSGAYCVGKSLLTSPPAPKPEEVGSFIFADFSECREFRYQ